MLTAFIRAAIIYLIVIVVFRAMGKRQVGQIQPYELILVIMVADFASSPLEGSGTPLINGILPIFALVLINSIITIITYKSQKLKSIINGKPTVLVHNGKIDVNEMKKQAFSVSDLLEELRLGGFSDITSVGCAILESSGKLSIFPISQKRPISPKDVNIKTAYETVDLTLIVDGKVQRNNLSFGKVSESWLMGLLKDFGAKPDEILLLTLTSSGVAHMQKKDASEPITQKKVLSPSEVAW